MTPLPPPTTLAYGDVVSPISLLVFGVGLALAIWIALRPAHLWPLLLIVNVIGNGPKVKGYVILDEIWTACLLAGALCYLTVERRRRRQGPPRSNLIPFTVWMTYLLLLSVAGIARHGDLLLLRWVFFFILLLTLSVVLYSRQDLFAFPTQERAAWLLLGAAFVYFSVWLIQGMWAEATFGEGARYTTQDFYWAGSAGAAFPALLVVPSVIIASTSGQHRLRLFGIATLVLMLGVGLYFESRMTWLATAILVLVSWRGASVRRVLWTGVGILTLAAISTGSIGNTLDPFLSDLAGGARAPIHADENDARSRGVQIRAGLLTVLDRPRTLLTGSGLYSNRELIVPETRSLLREYGGYSDYTHRENGVAIIRTVGFSAYVIDAGLIGVFLYVWNLRRAVKAIPPSNLRYLLAAAAIMSLAWLFVANLLDMVLLYLMIMPAGLLERWASAPRALRRQHQPDRRSNGAAFDRAGGPSA